MLKNVGMSLCSSPMDPSERTLTNVFRVYLSLIADGSLNQAEKIAKLSEFQIRSGPDTVSLDESLKALLNRCITNITNDTPNDFSNLNLDMMVLRGVNISGMNFENSSLVLVTFKSCVVDPINPPNFQGVRLSTLTYTQLYDLGIRDFQRIKLMKHDPDEKPDIPFKEVNMQGARFLSAFFSKMNTKEVSGIKFDKTALSAQMVLDLSSKGVKSFPGIMPTPVGEGYVLTKETYLTLYNAGFRDFRGVEMTGAMKNVPVKGCHFDGANFSSTSWNATFDRTVSWKGITWDQADLEHARFESSPEDRNLSPETEKRGSFKGTTLSKKALIYFYSIGERDFSRSILRDKDLRDLRFQICRFDGCDLRGVRFSPQCKQLTLCDSLVDAYTLQSLSNSVTGPNILSDLRSVNSHNLSGIKVDSKTLKFLLKHGVTDLSPFRVDLSGVNFSKIELRGVRLDNCKLTVEGISTIDNEQIGQELMHGFVDSNFNYYKDHPDARRNCMGLKFFKEAWSHSYDLRGESSLRDLQRSIANFSYEPNRDVYQLVVEVSLNTRSVGIQNLAQSIFHNLVNYEVDRFKHYVGSFLDGLRSGDLDPESIPYDRIWSSEHTRIPVVFELTTNLGEMIRSYPLALINELTDKLSQQEPGPLDMKMLEVVNRVVYKGAISADSAVNDAARRLLELVNGFPPYRELGKGLDPDPLYFFSSGDDTLIYAVTHEYLESALHPSETTPHAWGNMFVWCRNSGSQLYEMTSIESSGRSLDKILSANPILGEAYLRDHPSTLVRDLFVELLPAEGRLRVVFDGVFSKAPFRDRTPLDIESDHTLWGFFSVDIPGKEDPRDNIETFLKIALEKKPLGSTSDAHYLLYLSWIATQLSSDKFFGSSDTSVDSLRRLARKLVETAVAQGLDPTVESFANSFLEILKNDRCSAVLSRQMEAFIKRNPSLARIYKQFTPVAWR